jgi:hypothetical protein
VSGHPCAIVHLDLDAFFAAIEVLEDLTWRGEAGKYTEIASTWNTYGVRRLDRV